MRLKILILIILISFSISIFGSQSYSAGSIVQNGKLFVCVWNHGFWLHCYKLANGHLLSAEEPQRLPFESAEPIRTLHSPAGGNQIQIVAYQLRGKISDGFVFSNENATEPTQMVILDSETGKKKEFLVCDKDLATLHVKDIPDSGDFVLFGLGSYESEELEHFRFFFVKQGRESGICKRFGIESMQKLVYEPMRKGKPYDYPQGALGTQFAYVYLNHSGLIKKFSLVSCEVVERIQTKQSEGKGLPVRIVAGDGAIFGHSLVNEQGMLEVFRLVEGRWRWLKSLAPGGRYVFRVLDGRLVLVKRNGTPELIYD